MGTWLISKVRDEYRCHVMEPFSITLSLKVADAVVEPLTQCCLSIHEHHLRMFVFKYYGELEVTGDCGLRALLVRCRRSIKLRQRRAGSGTIPFSILTHQFPKFHVSLLLFFYIYSAFISGASCYLCSLGTASSSPGASRSTCSAFSSYSGASSHLRPLDTVTSFLCISYVLNIMYLHRIFWIACSV